MRIVARLGVVAALLSGGATTGCGGGGGGIFTLPGPSSNARLSNLEVSEGSLQPGFDPDQTLYVVGPAFLSTAITVTPTAEDPDATIVVRVGDSGTDIPVESGEQSPPLGGFVGLGPLATEGIQIEVTAEDGTTTRTYRVGVRDVPPSPQTYFKASNTDVLDQFGSAVATSGDTIVVGAPYEASAATGVGGDQSDDSLAGAGAVYVFVRSGGTWVQQAYLKAFNTGLDDRFGASVAIWGDTIVVGAPNERSDSTGVDQDGLNDAASGSGAAYVFVRSAGTWMQQAYLKASNTQTDDHFGHSVAIRGDRVAVGAPGEDSDAALVGGDEGNDAAPSSGAVYLFTRSVGTWAQEAYVKASNAEGGDSFGTSVALADARLLVGAPFEDSNATGIDGNQGNNAAPGAGAAYYYAFLDGFWWFRAYVKASNTDPDDEFGAAVALDDVELPTQALGDTEGTIEIVYLLIGAPGEASSATDLSGIPEDDSLPDAGAAYLFSEVTFIDLFLSPLDESAYLKASNTEGGDRFGASVALVLGTPVVGAPFEGSDAGGFDGDDANNGAPQSGAAYVFQDDSIDGWSVAAYMKASNARAGNQFGTSVALRGGTIVAGAPFEENHVTGINGNQAGIGAPGSGAAYSSP